MTALTSTLQLGDPLEHRGIVLVPLFPRLARRVEYVTLEEALPLGFLIRETSEAGSVPELIAQNPTGTNVLLYDGEELVGAKQNRILNVTVLVGAESLVSIPVSCVEQGRWAYRTSSFAPAAHTAYPELRRRKAERLQAEPLAPGRAQHEVWDAVAEKSVRYSVDSPTGAQVDIFASRRGDLDRLREAFPLQPGQSGAVLALGEAICLDYLSRPDAFARLYPKLLDGYLLDALERLDRKPAETTAVEGFAARVEAAERTRGRSPGLGDDQRLHAPGIVGSGLEVDGETVQLSAFTSQHMTERFQTRIARPTSRR